MYSSISRTTNTVLRPPTAKVLIQIKRRRTIPQLNIREPLSNNIQERRIQSNRRAHERHDDPCLPRIIALPQLVSKSDPTLPLKKPRLLFLPRSSPQLLARRILHPVYGREVLIPLDLGNLFCDLMLGRVGGEPAFFGGELEAGGLGGGASGLGAREE